MPKLSVIWLAGANQQRILLFIFYETVNMYEESLTRTCVFFQMSNIYTHTFVV